MCKTHVPWALVEQQLPTRKVQQQLIEKKGTNIRGLDRALLDFEPRGGVAPKWTCFLPFILANMTSWRFQSVHKAVIIMNEMFAVSPAMKQEPHFILTLCKLLCSRDPACWDVVSVVSTPCAREATFPGEKSYKDMPFQSAPRNKETTRSLINFNVNILSPSGATGPASISDSDHNGGEDKLRDSCPGGTRNAQRKFIASHLQNSD